MHRRPMAREGERRRGNKPSEVRGEQRKTEKHRATRNAGGPWASGLVYLFFFHLKARAKASNACLSLGFGPWSLVLGPCPSLNAALCCLLSLRPRGDGELLLDDDHPFVVRAASSSTRRCRDPRFAWRVCAGGSESIPGISYLQSS
jgi:hypothetical protein